jgi:hypothetical protein
MYGHFNDEALQQWCALYVRVVCNDSQRLANVVNACKSSEIGAALSKPQDINGLLAKTTLTDADCLAVFGYLCEMALYMTKKVR